MIKKMSIVILFAGLEIIALSQKMANMPAAKRPNIIIILADDMGYSDINCFGSDIQTPNINALAKTGLVMTQFYNASRCCPTRARCSTRNARSTNVNFTFLFPFLSFHL